MFKKGIKAFKKSWFYVNKLHLLLPFAFFLVTNFSGAMFSFLIFSLLFLIRILTQKVPLDPRRKFVRKTVVYKTTDVGNLKMDIWYPNTQKKRYPLVVYTHGGGWILGFRNQPNNVSWCRYLASKGFCAASIGYRLGLAKSIEEIMSDYSDALDYLREHERELKIDANKISLMGLSAGGHLALLYAAFHTFYRNGDRLKGIRSVVAFYTPTNLKDLFERDSKSFFARFSAFVTLKGTPAAVEELYEEYSPVRWLSSRMLPTLLVHGKEDTVVPFTSSVNFARELKRLKVPFRFLVHKMGNHTFEFTRKDVRTDWILEQTIRFLRAYMKGNEKLSLNTGGSEASNEN
jgi:acetyl esterase/lipase